MLRIAYISTLSESFSATEIDNLRLKAEHNNHNLGITSVMFIASGTVFHLLEGSNASIAALIYKISRDSRHNNVAIVLKQVIDRPIFKHCPIDIVTADSGRLSSMLDFVHNECANNFDALSAANNHRLNLVFGQRTTPDLARSTRQSAISRYKGTQLSLVSWPKPSDIQLSPKVMRLCSLLVRTPQAFETLIDQNIFKDEDGLLRHLELIRQSSKLKITKEPLAPRIPLSTPAASQKAQTTNRFSIGLRGFLSSVRQA